MSLLEAQPTGTAYILLFDDNDNAIALLGGANQAWALTLTPSLAPVAPTRRGPSP